MKTKSRPSESLNLVEIMRRFPTDDAARAYLEGVRWPDGPVCPHCGAVNTATALTANPAKKIRAGLYACQIEHCRKQFTVTVGTVFEASKVGLSTWLVAWHLMCASKKGIAALELQRLLGIGSYRTAWFMCMRIRESMKSGSFDGSPLRGTVEIDEAHVGGKGAAGPGRNARKSTIIVAVERGGKVRSAVIPDTTTATITPFVLANVTPSATLMTDKSHSYKAAAPTFAGHKAMNHGKGEYVRGNAHTGAADNFISIVKRGHYGVFHTLSKKYMQRYLDEFGYRYDHREATDGRKMARALEDLDGKRLRLVDLRKAG